MVALQPRTPQTYFANPKNMSEQKYSYWLKSGIYSGMQKFSMLLFGVGSVLLLTRALTIDEMGVWSLFLVFIGSNT